MFYRNSVGLLQRVSLLGILLATAPATWAADPSSGTLSAANPEIVYTSGPFSASNPSSDADGGVCPDDDVSCDHFDLTVDFAGVPSTQTVTITTRWDLAEEDYDVYLLRPDGSVERNAASSDNPEVMVLRVHELGEATYRIRIIPFAVVPGSTTTTSIVLGQGAPPQEFPACEENAKASDSGANHSAAVANAISTLAPGTTFEGFVSFAERNKAAHRAMLQRHGLVVLRDYEKYLQAVFVRGPIEGFAAVIEEPGVTFVEENRQLQVLMDTAVWATGVRVTQEAVAGGPYFAPSGAALSGAGVTVAVVDTGVDGAHPDFEGRVLHNFKYDGTDFIDVGAATTDTSSGHGTHVAGTVLGSGVASKGVYPVAEAAPKIEGSFAGVAHGAQLIGYSTGEAPDPGVGAPSLLLFVTDAFEHLLANYDSFTPRVRAVSVSLGDGGGSVYNPGSARSAAVRGLICKGTNVVFAAGNDGGDGSADQTSSLCKDPTPGVICVASYSDGGTGSKNAGLSSFSSRGKQGDPKNYPDIAAPGSNITAPCTQPQPGQTTCATGAETRWQPYYGTISGTSMATPHVSGAIALLTEAAPDLNPVEVENLLQRTARKVSSNGAYDADPQLAGSTTNFGFGAGLLDLPAALTSLGINKAGITTPEGPSVVVDGDSEPSIRGAADIVKLSIEEATSGDMPGIRYLLDVRDITDFAGAEAIRLRVTGNFDGVNATTAVTLRPDGLTGDGLGATASAPATSVGIEGNTLRFFVPLEFLGAPPIGAPGHNLRAESYVLAGAAATLTDLAPSSSDVIGVAQVEPMFGKPYTVLTKSVLPVESACEEPGITVVTDVGGDGTSGTGADDLLSAHVAQPESEGRKLVFTIKVDNLETLAAGSAYYVSFNSPDNVIRGVRMKVTDPTAPEFLVYVAGASNAGTIDGRFVDAFEAADPASGYDPDGTIRIVVDPAQLGGATAGQTLSAFNGGSTQSSNPGDVDGTPTATAMTDEMPNGLGRVGSYLVQDAACSLSPFLQPGTRAPVGSYSVFGGWFALPTLGLLLLAGLAGLRRRH